MRHELRQLRPGAGPERVPDGVVPPKAPSPPKASSPATTTAYAVQPSGSTLRPRSALPLTRSSGTLARPTPASRLVGDTKFPAREGGGLWENLPQKRPTPHADLPDSTHDGQASGNRCHQSTESNVTDQPEQVSHLNRHDVTHQPNSYNFCQLRARIGRARARNSASWREAVSTIIPGQALFRLFSVSRVFV